MVLQVDCAKWWWKGGEGKWSKILRGIEVEKCVGGYSVEMWEREEREEGWETGGRRERREKRERSSCNDSV